MEKLKDSIDRLKKKADFTTHILKGYIEDQMTYSNKCGYNQALEDVIGKISDTKIINMIKGLKKD